MVRLDPSYLALQHQHSGQSQIGKLDARLLQFDVLYLLLFVAFSSCLLLSTFDDSFGTNQLSQVLLDLFLTFFVDHMMVISLSLNVVL